MELSKESVPKPKCKRVTYLKKLDPEAAKALASLKEKANKKTFGRKVRDSEVLALGLRLIEPKHLTELQEKTLTERDRLSIAHEAFQKANGKITLDEFIGRLIRGQFQEVGK